MNRIFPFFLWLLALPAMAQWNGTVTYVIDARLDGMDNMPAEMRTMLTNNMPKETAISLRSNQMYSRMTNAANRVMAEFVTTSDGKTYFLRHDERKAYLMRPEDNQKYDPPKVTNTGETATIAGYSCTKYTIEPAEKKFAKQNVWVAKDIPLPSGVKFSAGNNPYDYTRLGINGFPLKVEYNGRGPGENMVMTAKTVSTDPAPAEKFAVPSGYTVEPFKQSAMMSAMLRGMN